MPGGDDCSSFNRGERMRNMTPAVRAQRLKRRSRKRDAESPRVSAARNLRALEKGNRKRQRRSQRRQAELDSELTAVNDDEKNKMVVVAASYLMSFIIRK